MTIAERKDQVDFIWKSSFQYELEEELKQTLRQGALVGIQTALETALIEELNEEIGCEPYERLPEGPRPPEMQRSGFFGRQLDTEYGRINDLKIPKLRRGNKEREWNILVRYQRAKQTLLDSALYLYLLGLSMRDLQETFYVFTGAMLSPNAINRITLSVEEKVAAWRNRAISQSPPILIVDGVWVTILYPTGETFRDKSGHLRVRMRSQEQVILAALAVFPDGRYHLLHYEVASREDEHAWTSFFKHLTARGLDKEAVEMVVSDGTKGLLPAMETYLPRAELQRCTVHKIRGFKRYLKYRHLSEIDEETGKKLSEEEARSQRRKQITTDAHDIFKVPTQDEALLRLDAFNEKWQPIEPEAVSNFNWGIKRCFIFYKFDTCLHRLVHSTNLIEHFFGEFRDKADEIGAFPNQGSCLTLFFLVMQREHAKHRRFEFAKTS